MKERSDSMGLDVIELRRNLHQYPEVGFTEFRTASRVVEILQSLGYEVKYGQDVMVASAMRGIPAESELTMAYQRALSGVSNPDITRHMQGGLTGVVAVLRGTHPGPTVAFRFDMDALPILESDDIEHTPAARGFASQHEGQMHACGHDGHTAVGLMLAEAMSDGQFSGTLKLVFQPAEEGGRGAKAMVEKGVVDDVDTLFCMHLGLGVPQGTVCGGTEGWLASTKLKVDFHGVPAHAAAAPELGRNALLGAATALLNIHALPRFSSGMTRVNVGVLEGGTAPNIIAYHARMMVEMRAENTEVSEDLLKRVERIIDHSAGMHELTYETEIIGQAEAIQCDDDVVSMVLEEATHVDGVEDYRRSHQVGASEDASLLIRRVQERGGQATYMIIGTTIPAPHHHQKFDIDEQALPVAVELLTRLAKRTLVRG